MLGSLDNEIRVVLLSNVCYQGQLKRQKLRSSAVTCGRCKIELLAVK